MRRIALRDPITVCIAALSITMVARCAPAATVNGTRLQLPSIAADPLPGTSSISLSIEHLTPTDRIELSLPKGVGEANNLQREWTRFPQAPDDVPERWTFHGTRVGSIALTLDTFGMEPGAHGLLSIFSTDPETGDELQSHWWLIARKRPPVLIPAGRFLVRKMVAVTVAPGNAGRWQDVPRDAAGRLLLRQSDPRLAEVLPWAHQQNPYVEATSIAEAEGSGQISKETDWDGAVFTDWICNNWFGLTLQITGAPAGAVVTTFDLDYTIYQSVDSSRYKAQVARTMGNIPSHIVPLYAGTQSGQKSHSKSFTGLTDWAGLNVNDNYTLYACNIYGSEYAYIDYFKIILYYNTGSGGNVDLVADDVRTDFDTVASGGQLGYYYDAHVAGSGSVASSFSTGVYLSNDAGISTSDRLLTTISEPTNLSAGDQFGATQFSGQVMIPASVSPGTYWVGVILDNTNAVAETDEGNNAASRQITIVSSASQPNLKVSDCSVSPVHASSGSTVQLSFHTRNTGSTGAAYFSYNTFISTNATFDSSDQLLGGLDVPGGWPAGYDGGTQTIAIPLTGVTDGTYYVGYVADPDNEVPETNENDNFCVARVTVGSGGGSGVTRWLIAGAASTTGANHANWKTQVSIVNPDNVPHTVNLYYVKKGASWPGVLLSGPINLAPNQAWFSDDPLAGLRPTSGMMYVVTDAPGPVVTTRTYNDVAGHGRFGQGITAQAIGSSPAGEFILPMAHSGSGQYHANLGLVQADSGSFTVEVGIYSSSGSLLATKRYTRSGAFDQISNIFKDMGLGGTVVTGAWIRVKLISGSPAYWTTYLSLIDETTGDPTYIAPVTP